MARLKRKHQLIADAVILGITAAVAAWIFSRWSDALRLVMLLAVSVAYVALSLPHIGVAWLDRLEMWVRGRVWNSEQGRHHAFAGVRLRISDDGRHQWIEGEGLRRVLGSSDSDEVLAARHAGRWRRLPDGELLLRVDAVVDVLANGPDRLDPRQIRLRRYFEREVLFPAGEKRRRTGTE